VAQYDAKNPEALRRVIAAGVKVSVFPTDVIQKMYESSEELYKTLTRQIHHSRKYYASQKEFRDSAISITRRLTSSSTP
jgi:TRAP-type mannitol/chloroaromatic compound transport system substrate-binding protein